MRAVLALPLMLGLCEPDQTASVRMDRDADWRLTELDGAPFPAEATIRFPAEGEVVGEGPCNGFRATQTRPYPLFRVAEVATTRRSCPDLDAEAAFLQALEAATLARDGGDVLILSNGEGRELVFRQE